ncbi:MAG: pyridoxamine 5'-phosphate oxidase family protein [Kouleothrix sp.]|nr:pyridoxamine 5'-phosphate oxidase family protein [Kouleothrix sp.]
MPQYDIGQWEQTQAELEIRRWLYSIGQWAPGADRAPGPDEDERAGALPDDEIDQVLRAEVVGRIGCHASGKTYVVPVLYAYDGAHIYGHSSEGMKLRMMRANPAVCFEVDHMAGPTDWHSVIAWGQFEELHGDAADQAERLLIDRMRPLLADRTTAPTPAPGAGPEARRAVVYRITLSERSGRREQR